MNPKRFLFELATLVAAASVCALVANALAGKERKLLLARGAVPAAVPTTIPRVSPAAPTSASPASAALPVSSPSAPVPAASGPVLSPPAKGAATVAKIATTSPPSTSVAPARPTPAPAARPSPEAEVRGRFPAHGQPYREISGEDVGWLHERGVLVLDARRTQVFAEGHVAGAHPVSVWESDVNDKVTALAGEGRDGGYPVVVYCSGGDCEDSHLLCEKLYGAGFNNLLVYRDGWPDWKKRGGPSRTGAEP